MTIKFYIKSQEATPKGYWGKGPGRAQGDRGLVYSIQPNSQHEPIFYFLSSSDC
jgi:hypothetical protein